MWFLVRSAGIMLLAPPIWCSQIWWLSIFHPAQPDWKLSFIGGFYNSPFTPIILWISLLNLRMRFLERDSPWTGSNLLRMFSSPPMYPPPPHFLSFLSFSSYDSDKFLSLPHAEKFNNNISSLNILLSLTLHPKWLAKALLHPNVFRALVKKSSGEYNFLYLIRSTEVQLLFLFQPPCSAYTPAQIPGASSWVPSLYGAGHQAELVSWYNHTCSGNSDKVVQSQATYPGKLFIFN